MLITVYVTPNAREARVVRVSEDYFGVQVDESRAERRDGYVSDLGDAFLTSSHTFFFR